MLLRTKSKFPKKASPPKKHYTVKFTPENHVQRPKRLKGLKGRKQCEWKDLNREDSEEYRGTQRKALKPKLRFTVQGDSIKNRGNANVPVGQVPDGIVAEDCTCT